MEARKFTQIIFVLAVSFGCFIHGTTVSYPSVLMPGLEKTNATKAAAGNNSNSNNPWSAPRADAQAGRKIGIVFV